MLSRTVGGNLELIKKLGWGRSEDETHDRLLPCPCCSIDRRFCKGEELQLNLFACSEGDHPARRRDECDISAADLAAFRRAFTLDPLPWFSDFAMELHWFVSDAVCRRVERLVLIWNAGGACDQLLLGGLKSMGFESGTDL